MGQRLIDANALDDSFRHSIVKCKQWFEDAAVFGEEESKVRAEQAYVTFMECSMRLKKQPTVDAVPVVRCGECKHFIEPSWECQKLIDRDAYGEADARVYPDFYCAYGERKDGEHDNPTDNIPNSL